MDDGKDARETFGSIGFKRTNTLRRSRYRSILKTSFFHLLTEFVKIYI